jgi:hypothetical protein
MLYDLTKEEAEWQEGWMNDYEIGLVRAADEVCELRGTTH